MPLDLYRTYKKFYQRSYRNPEDQDLLEMTQIVHDLVRNLYRIQSKRELSKEELGFAFSTARNLFDLEKSYGGFSVIFSRNLLKAFEINDFEIQLPKHKISSWLEEDNHLGTLYVLTAKSRPDQTKLGVTQGFLDERIAKYQHRHGYSVDIYFYRHDVPTPFRHEEAITKKYLEHKFSGNSDGGSNEWFYLSPEVLKNEIENIQITTGDS